MEETTQQSDQAEIKIRLAENGLMVRIGKGWLVFPTWAEASTHIEARLKALKEKREESKT